MNSLLLQTSLLKKSVIKAEPSEDAATPSESPAPIKGEREDKVVLTLFGNPSNPKHLFSSLQKPLKVPLSSASGRYVDLNAQLRESALPNGITTTKVAPYNIETQPETSRTLGEVFAPPPTLQQLEPPRKTRPWPRNSSTLWIDPFEAITNIKSIPGEKNNYGFASLPAGQWLQYGGVTSSPSYWSRKQKQHGQNSEDVDFAEKLEETPVSPEDVSDLVQGAYSSFAPSFDSSGAIVQSHSKNLVWYAKRGARHFRTLVSLYNAARQELPALQEGTTDLDESSLEDAVKTFEPDGLPEEKPEETDSKDLDHVLREVSELLETLNSYNQVRSLDPLNTNLPNPESKDSATDVGAPDAPSAAEKEIYETLRSSLAAIVATLPPYAVAKLNGEQLADLNISQKVVIKNPDYHGTMEQDDYTTQQMRLAAAAPAAAGVSRTSTPHIAPASRSGSYQAPQAAAGAYNQRVYPSNARVPPPAGGYQAGQQYYVGRQPSTSGPYTPGAAPQSYASARPAVPAAGRPGYVPPYSQPAAALQQFQRAGPNGYGPYSTPQGTSPAQGTPQPYAARSGQPGAYNASFGAGRSASPQKPPAAYATPQPRTPYANATSSNPQQRYHPQQQPPHYGAYPPNQASPPPATYSNSAVPVNYPRSAAEQTAVMDRNKAQIAANQQRQNSGTPQPLVPQQRPQSSQSSSQERSVTPGSKPNGTPTPVGMSQ